MPKKSKAKQQQKFLDEIKKEFSNPSKISKESEYAMGMLGIQYKQIKTLKLDDFEGDDDEKRIKFDFYNHQRDKFLLEIYECKQKVIDKRLCDEHVLAEEEEEHLKQLLVEEDKKLQKIFTRQDRETRRLLNEQLNTMNHYENQKKLQLLQQKRQERKQQELNKIAQEKERKKQKIIERRQKAEELQREQEQKRYFDSLQKRRENAARLAEANARKERHRQNLIHKRIKEFHTKRIRRIQSEQKLDAQQQRKMHEIESRYNIENNRYISNIQNRVKSVQQSYEQRRKRHEQNYNKQLKHVRDRHRELLNKQRADQQRLEQFQIQKQAELRRKKMEKQNKIHATLIAAKGGEAQRIKQIEENAKRAQQNREKFFAIKAREDHLKRLVASLKKQAAIETAERTARANQFKNDQLLQKNERDDFRRMKDLNLREVLREQRIMNDKTVKFRQEQLKEEILEARKNGDINKLKKLINELESHTTTTNAATINASPIKQSKDKNKNKVNIMMSPKNLDSSIVKTLRAKETKIKANIFRGSGIST